MTGQTPLNKEADDKQQQRGSSTSTGNTALTSEDDLTLHELSNTSTPDCRTPGEPESTEDDDGSLEPAVDSPQGNSNRRDPNSLPPRITAPPGTGYAKFVPEILRLQRRWKILDGFSRQMLRQRTAPQQRKPEILTSLLKKNRPKPQLENPAEYLASQRRACMRMLEREIEQAIDD